MRARAALVGSAAALLMLLAMTGCEPVDRQAMIQLPPPRDWVQDISESRLSKDGYFSSSAESPLLPGDRESFGGLDYWQPDPDLYFVGAINEYAEREQFEIVTTSGQSRPCEKLGWLRFDVDGQSHTLQVYRLLDLGNGVESLLLPFRDGTSGAETYPAGRYIDLRGPQGGPFVLDFNRAYNPSCAYGDPQRFACPMAPPENTLQVRIEAGERGYKVEGGVQGVEGP